MSRPATIALVLALAAGAVADDAPTALTFTVAAQKKMEAGDFAGANDDLTRAIGLAPRNASLRFERARCRARLGDDAGTAADLAAAERLSPADYPVDADLWRAAVTEARRRGRAKDPDLALVAAEVAAIRERRFKAPVAHDRRTPQEFAALLDAVASARAPRDSAGLARIGVAPAGVDLAKETSRALASQVAAYYDAETKTYYDVAASGDVAHRESIAAHELVHGLQDQLHDLLAWGRRHGGAEGVRDCDREFALRCVTEGEAAYVQTIWEMRGDRTRTLAETRKSVREVLAAGEGLELADMIRAARRAAAATPEGSDTARAAADLERLDPYVVLPLLASYVVGARLVARTDASEKGWDAVDALYADPPESSEQCLHPTKRLAERDRPTPIALPDLPELASAGWTVADTAVHGELYLGLLLARQGADAAAARRGAEGWDGDVYRAWRMDGGGTAVVFATTWDTPRDAAEFFDAYRASLPKRYPKLAEEAGSDLTSIRYACGDASLGTGAIFIRGREVFAVEGFDATTRTRVAAALAALDVPHVE